MQHLQETEATSAEVKYIQDATDVLLQCRLVLKYSYIVGYFMPEDKITRNLFEFQQEVLEKTAEQLSEALEATEEKIKVVNLTRLAEKKIQLFLEAAMEDELEK
jgi:ariadne-1